MQQLSPEKLRELLREPLAELEHDQWARWMRHLFGKSALNADGSATIPAASVERWMRQMNAAYEQLSEAEKESDRAEADRVLQLLQNYQRQNA